MMNRWTFLIFLIVIILVITSFIIIVNSVEQIDGSSAKYYSTTYYNVVFGLLLSAFAIPILAFIVYLFYNGMFSFALCR